MKRNLIIAFSFFAIMSMGKTLRAQDAELLPDQNPRYAESVNKYSVLLDSLSHTQGTTVQQTYKAYDWYEAREEKRQLRRSKNSYAPGYWNSSFYYPYFSRPYTYMGFGW